MLVYVVLFEWNVASRYTGTEKGHVEIACSRFVRSREEAVLLFREIFA
jgi:hypothetical protein